MSDKNNKQTENEAQEDQQAARKKTEEDIKIYEEAVSIDRSRQKSRKIFVFYIIGLFCIALGLILVSYVMQAHANQQLETLGSQLTEQTDAANGAKAKADQLQDSIDSLKQELEQTKQSNDTLTEQTQAQTKQIDALNQLWQLEKAWQNGENSTARSIIAALDTQYTRDVLVDTAQEPLSGDAATEYAQICEDLGE